MMMSASKKVAALLLQQSAGRWATGTTAPCAALGAAASRRAFAADSDGGHGVPLTEQLKQAAHKASDTVSETVKGMADRVKEGLGGAKEFVQETAQRVKHEQEGYGDALKAGVERVREAGSHTADVARNQMAGMTDRIAEKAAAAGDRMADAGDVAARAAAAGNAPAVDAATGTPSGTHDPATGTRGPAAQVTMGRVAQAEGMGLPSGERMSAEDAAGRADEALRMTPEGTQPLEQKGAHLAKDADGQMSSQT